MKKRCCANCVYAGKPTGRWMRVVLSRWPGLLLCTNHPDGPGELSGVASTGCCCNFVPKRTRTARTELPEPPDDSIRYVPLTQGKYATVDAADFERVSGYRWCLQRARNQLYAWRKDRGKTVRMHQFLMNPPPGMVVDHIDGNGLNNRTAHNLRVCTPQENAYNRHQRKREGQSSRFIGVYRFKERPDKWYVVVQAARRKGRLGPFDDEIEAARARDRLAVGMQGRYAQVNFPEEWPLERRLAVVAEAGIQAPAQPDRDGQNAEPGVGNASTTPEFRSTSLTSGPSSAARP